MVSTMTEEEWQHLYENFETTELLSAVDAVDCLRDDLNDGEGLSAARVAYQSGEITRTADSRGQQRFTQPGIKDVRPGDEPGRTGRPHDERTGASPGHAGEAGGVVPGQPILPFYFC